MNWFEGFEARHFAVSGVPIYAHASRGLPAGRQVLLLLHGFPQSHVMWNRVAHLLAQDMVAVMDALGIDQFLLCGHDRGGGAA